MSLGNGRLPISPNGKPSAAVPRNISSLNDDAKITNYLLPPNNSSKVLDENAEPMVVGKNGRNSNCKTFSKRMKRTVRDD